MKLIIAGGRAYDLNVSDRASAVKLIYDYDVKEIVSGSQKGVDKAGEKLAEELNISCKIFVPDWNRHGKAAGPIRNKHMAEYADSVLLFPGGAGTESMYMLAKSYKLRIFRPDPVNFGCYYEEELR